MTESMFPASPAAVAFALGTSVALLAATEKLTEPSSPMRFPLAALAVSAIAVVLLRLTVAP